MHKYEDVTITSEGLQNLNLCSVPVSPEHRGIFIVPHLLRHWASDFAISSKGPHQLVALYAKQGTLRTYSYQVFGVHRGCEYLDTHQVYIEVRTVQV